MPSGLTAFNDRNIISVSLSYSPFTAPNSGVALVALGSNLISQAPPVGSQEIITELSIQMVDETTSEDLITEGI